MEVEKIMVLVEVWALLIGIVLIAGVSKRVRNTAVTVPIIFSAEGISVGSVYGNSVDHEGYKPPFRFTGTVKRVTSDTSGEAIQDAEAEMRRALAKQ